VVYTRGYGLTYKSLLTVDVKVNCVGDINYAVDGNTVTVAHDLTCLVGYEMDGEYVNLAGINNSDCTVSFTVPSDITEVILAVKGDVNNDEDVDSVDALQVLKYDAAITELTDIEQFVADVNNDGDVNTIDAVSVLKYDAGIMDSL